MNSDTIRLETAAAGGYCRNGRAKFCPGNHDRQFQPKSDAIAPAQALDCGGCKLCAGWGCECAMMCDFIRAAG